MSGASICWVHIGDLHLEAEDGWESRDRLRAIVAEINAHMAGQAHFVFLPGDNANHGTAEQYAQMTAALSPLTLPWRVVPGDHDFEPGTLDTYKAAIPEENRPEHEVIAGHRCIFLDVVSAGPGGPDFRLTTHHRNRIAENLARAQAEGQVPLVFMHAYPGDLAADGDQIAQMFADGGVAFVDTGHTHYSELLNDGRVIYGATRSTGQIEEDGGKPGFSIACVHDGVPSWRFRRLGAPLPHVQIVAPCDRRLVTRPADPRHVPRPGQVSVVARVFGADEDGAVFATVDGAQPVPMQRSGALWSADVPIPDAGLHRIEVRCGEARDIAEVLVRPADDIPKRPLPVALGRDCHAIGAWPVAGLEGTQLGPNKNGGRW
ncbi:metallophosphoesterase family protein [Novosphingobium sp. Leaf2]|uniref:metallophosphoesterase family protein n=1 Tax=Novosphingobium sp. Leaf2 TaxID=1735670 RepID=UPI0006FB29D8|nr:metallophosphoesterase [Novosphingobium sp. Leaf2]KQM20393.1 metallophosphoesterase [Novosphingobium sp. Leaf2]